MDSAMPEKRHSSPKSVYEVKAEHELDILKMPGVTGIGIGQSDSKAGLAIKIYVERLTPELKKRLPTHLEGYPVVTEATGEFRAV
jgi:hypothetical protein